MDPKSSQGCEGVWRYMIYPMKAHADLGDDVATKMTILCYGEVWIVLLRSPMRCRQ